jgi:NAD-dependent deacetylase
MKNIVILTGAGISAESGISTFRDSGGLWENYSIYEVATPEAFAKNPSLVLQFYNDRRRQLHDVKPNVGHTALVSLESKYNVHIVTQNVDNLHEKAGSTKVLHLHGELFKVRSIKDARLIYHWEKDLNWGDCGDDGHQLRPHIVWFGEAVPEMDRAIDLVQNADIFIVIGTSLNVYPAAGLGMYCKPNCEKYLINPDELEVSSREYQIIKEKAGTGVPKLVKELLSKA